MMRSRVALAIAGMLLIGGVSATAAVMSTPHARLTGLSSAQTQNNGAATAVSGSTTAGSSATATDGTTGSDDPTATRSVPTATPAGTATPQTPSVHGTILSINATAQTFQISQRSGTPITITVNGSTQYQGIAASFGALQTNMRVYVTGQTQSDGTFLATVINAQPQDN